MKEFKYLTKKESEGLCYATTDLETGNYLIERRSNDKLLVIQELVDAINAKNPDERQKEIVEWHKVCSDYYYAKKKGYIDDDGKLFEIKWKDNKNNIVENV